MNSFEESKIREKELRFLLKQHDILELDSNKDQMLIHAMIEADREISCIRAFRQGWLEAMKEKEE